MMLKGEITSIYLLFAEWIPLNTQTRISVRSDYGRPTEGPIWKDVICRTLTLCLDFISGTYRTVRERSKNIFTLGL